MKKIQNWEWAIIVVVLISMLNACMSESKLIGNAIKSEAVTNAILTLHPCFLKDSLVVKSDTLITHDTATNTVFNHDTIGNYIHDTIEVKIKVTLAIHDTVQHYQEDTRKTELLIQRIADYSKTIAALQQQVKDCPKTTDKWLWLFISTLVALVVSWFLFIYSKIKKL